MRDEQMVSAVVNRLIVEGYSLFFYMDGNMFFEAKVGGERRVVYVSESVIKFISYGKVCGKMAEIDKMEINYEDMDIEALQSDLAFVYDQSSFERWSITLGRKSIYGDTYTKKETRA